MYGAVDIGGTKTLIAVFDAAGAIQEQFKFPTPSDYTAFLDALKEAVQDLKTHDFQAVTVAVPGSINREHGIGHAFGNLPWKDVPVMADAERIFHAPVLIENDANLAGLSEALLLYPEYQKTLYVTISTGIGTGIIVDGEIDPAYADSEGGDIMLEHDGELKKWESFASGKAIVARYGKRASDIEDPKIWQALAREFATGLLSLLAIVQPDVVVIGGGVGSHFSKYGNFLMQELKKYENPLLPIPPIRQAARPEEAVTYGCFELARKNYATAS